MSRRRPAPSALRTAISSDRAVPRAIIRLATLAHATSRSSDTAPSSISSTGLASPAIWSRSVNAASRHFCAAPA